MKTIAIKFILIVAGLLLISCTILAMGYSYILFQFLRSQITSPITSILYTIPTILSFILFAIGTLGVPAMGFGLIIKGCAYRGK